MEKKSRKNTGVLVSDSRMQAKYFYCKTHFTARQSGKPSQPSRLTRVFGGYAMDICSSRPIRCIVSRFDVRSGFSSTDFSLCGFRSPRRKSKPHRLKRVLLDPDLDNSARCEEVSRFRNGEKSIKPPLFTTDQAPIIYTCEDIFITAGY